MSMLLGGNAKQREEHRKEQEEREDKQMARNRERDLEAEVARLRDLIEKDCPTCEGTGKVPRNG